MSEIDDKKAIKAQKNRENVKKWRENNREKFRKIQREYKKRKCDNDPSYREYLTQYQRERIANKSEEYKEQHYEKQRCSAKKNYYRNLEENRIKKAGRYYMNKLWDTRENFLDDDDWLLSNMRGCKSDAVCEWVITNLDTYMDKFEKKYAKKQQESNGDNEK